MALIPPRSFVIGQCWTSEAEPELGVGYVRSKNAQTVTVDFPLTSETRCYGLRSAPLKRLEFREGDTLQLADGKRHKVSRIEEREGLFWYHSGTESVVESLISPKLRIQRPLQRFAAGHWDSLEAFDLRQLTLKLAARQQLSASRGMIGPRARLLPHQLYVASQVASRAFPRALLADEVGLGKTIEAGWILHRNLVRGRARRALVIVPPALVNQWFVELLKRFNLSFWVPSSQVQEELTTEDLLEQERVILGTDALNDPQITAGLLESPWDLVIVDEAHRIAEGSPEYSVLEALAAKSPGLLLLTATPEQLGLEGHFSRLRLIDPARFSSWDQFKKDHASYREVLKKAEALLEKGGPKARAEALELIDRHGTGRIYYRNSRKVVSAEGCSFPARKLVEHKIADGGLESWLGEFAAARRTEKTLLICASTATAIRLEKRLRDDFGVKAVAFHEDLPLLARDRNAAYFEDPQGASILLSSELGGEGRNFQHASNLVLADLPEDPDVLEQRIGRLDRIGQKQEIQIHVPYPADSREERLLRWHREVFNAFEAPVQGAAQVHQKFIAELAPALSSKKATGLATLLKNARAEYVSVLKEIESGRDRLIEIQSFDADEAGKITRGVADSEYPAELREYLDLIFDALGLQVEDLDKESMFVEAGDSAFASYVPALPPEGMRFTFSRDKAVARDDLNLMSWDHPLVTGTIDALASQELGNTAVAVWTSDTKALPLAVEAHFTFDIVCEPRWNVAEFFAPKPVRVMLDGPGTDLTAKWPASELREAIEALPERLVLFARRIPGDALKRLLYKARDQAEERADEIRDAAIASMEASVERELGRLEELRAKNGLVSELEIQWWKDRQVALTAALQGAHARLDAFLLILPQGLGG